MWCGGRGGLSADLPCYCPELHHATLDNNKVVIRQFLVLCHSRGERVQGVWCGGAGGGGSVQTHLVIVQSCAW